MNVVPKQEAIDLAERDYGYFALISNDIKDPIEALKLYRSKDLIEKAFGNLKERLNMRRTSVSSEQNLEGKLFVQFVALMYLSYITAAMNEKGLFKDYTLHDILDNLDVIECFNSPATPPRWAKSPRSKRDYLHRSGSGFRPSYKSSGMQAEYPADRGIRSLCRRLHSCVS